MGVGVGAIGEGERPTIGVGGNLAVGEAGGEEEGPRSTHSQLDDVRHDPVERHLKYFDSNHVVKFPAAVACYSTPVVRCECETSLVCKQSDPILDFEICPRIKILRVSECSLRIKLVRLTARR